MQTLSLNSHITIIEGLRKQIDALGTEAKERIYRLLETPMEGFAWPIVLAVLGFAAIIAAIYLSGWSHIANGP